MDTNKRIGLLALNDKLREQALKTPKGSFWRHYKGDIYVIKGFGIAEDTGEVEIQYAPIMRDCMTITCDEEGRTFDADTDLEIPYEVKFHRKASIWSNVVQTDTTAPYVPRFTQVEPVTTYQPVKTAA